MKAKDEIIKEGLKGHPIDYVDWTLNVKDEGASPLRTTSEDETRFKELLRTYYERKKINLIELL